MALVAIVGTEVETLEEGKKNERGNEIFNLVRTSRIQVTTYRCGNHIQCNMMLRESSIH